MSTISHNPNIQPNGDSFLRMKCQHGLHNYKYAKCINQLLISKKKKHQQYPRVLYVQSGQYQSSCSTCASVPVHL